MVITFYNTPDAYNVMNKQLQMIKGFNNLPLKKDMDVLKPIFEMTFDTVYPLTINYMYIEDFKRYYFTKTENLTGGRVRILGEIDVLMSWRKEILAHGAWIERQVKNNAYIRDSEIQQISTPIAFARKILGIEFNTMQYVLIANGKE